MKRNSNKGFGPIGLLFLAAFFGAVVFGTSIATGKGMQKTLNLHVRK